MGRGIAHLLSESVNALQEGDSKRRLQNPRISALLLLRRCTPDALARDNVSLCSNQWATKCNHLQMLLSHQKLSFLRVPKRSLKYTSVAAPAQQTVCVRFQQQIFQICWTWHLAPFCTTSTMHISMRIFCLNLLALSFPIG